MIEPEEPLCGSDAAYVVGALSPAQRREYEAHLPDCAVCRRSVRELAGIPGLLSRVTPGDFDEPPPVPETLLPSLVTVLRRDRLRRRLVAAVVGAAAAAAVVLLVLQLRPATEPTHPVAMHPVVAGPVHASVALVDKPWGTDIEMRCSYTGGREWSSTPRYRLVVTDRAGSSRPVATWRAVPGQVSTITGSVAWQVSDIASLRLETGGGKALLALRP